MINKLENDNFFQMNKKKLGWLLLSTFILGFIFGYNLLAKDRFFGSEGVQIAEKNEKPTYPTGLQNNKSKY